MSKKAIAVLSVLFAVSCLASYLLGIHSAKNAHKGQIMEVQAMLSFNHMIDYEQLLACMEQGRFDETAEKLKNLLITERELLASHLNSVSSSELNSYIEIRTDQSLEALKNYKSGRGRSWSEPTCP